MSTLTLSRVDDALRLDRHRHNPQRHPHQPVDHRNDQGQAGFPDTHHLAEPENTPLWYCVTTFTDSDNPIRATMASTTRATIRAS